MGAIKQLYQKLNHAMRKQNTSLRERAHIFVGQECCCTKPRISIWNNYGDGSSYSRMV